MSIKVTVTAHRWIAMADGVRLGARIWLPETAEAAPVPAILEYIPYRKDDYSAARDAATHGYLAARGYACVRVDMRGSGSSDGLLLDEYSEAELADGAAVIAWIAEQPWCNGKVGMMGISWGGITGLQLAQRGAANLEAVIALGATERRYYDDGGYYMGCLLGQTIGWAAVMLGYNTRPPDPKLVGERWRAMWLERLESVPPYLDRWLRHQHNDDYWKRASVGQDYGAVKVPVYAVSGHADCWPNTVPRLLERLSCPRQGLQGPWCHRYPHLAIPGPAIGFLQEAIRWFDHWLKGLENGVGDDPMYRVYMQDGVRPQSYYETRPGRWICEAAWPSGQVDEVALHLTGAGLSADPGAEAGLALCSPQTVGLASGEYMPWFVFGPGPELPDDQRIEDEGSLVFDSEPLEARVEVLGNPAVIVEFTCEKPQALLAVRLCDLWPDGASTLVTRGILNLSQRNGTSDPEPLVPGERTRVRIELDHVAYGFGPGNRLRVALSTSYWPMAWPSPEATPMTVFAGPSLLQLPTRAPRPDAPEDPGFGPPETGEPMAVRQLRPHDATRRQYLDPAGGCAVLEIVTDNGRVQFEDDGLEMGSHCLQRHSIAADDPLSARAEYVWRWEYGRGPWRISTRSHLVMTCDAEFFHVTSSIEAWEGETRVFEKSRRQSYPRDHF